MDEPARLELSRDGAIVAVLKDPEGNHRDARDLAEMIRTLMREELARLDNLTELLDLAESTRDRYRAALVELTNPALNPMATEEIARAALERA